MEDPAIITTAKKPVTALNFMMAIFVKLNLLVLATLVKTMGTVSTWKVNSQLHSCAIVTKVTLGNFARTPSFSSKLLVMAVMFITRLWTGSFMITKVGVATPT